MTPEYYVRYLPFPARVGAVVVPNDDGSFDIYISSRLSDEARKERLAHELTHIREDHFYRPIPVAAAEAEANGTAAPLNTNAPPAAPAPVSAPSAPAPDAADAWLASWQRAMAWAEQMMKQRGWPDTVPNVAPSVRELRPPKTCTAKFDDRAAGACAGGKGPPAR